eukprot:6039468-Amphidinium_carterae.1
MALTPWGHKGRLLILEFFARHGESSFVIYVMYDLPTARWDASALAKVNAFFVLIAEDMCMRGQIPAVVVGDCNVELQESVALQ